MLEGAFRENHFLMERDDRRLVHAAAVRPTEQLDPRCFRRQVVVAFERQAEPAERVVVDACSADAVAGFAGEAEHGGKVTGDERNGEAVLGLVGKRQRLVEGVEGPDCHHRAKNLLAQQSAAGGQVGAGR